jgi:hypothetical protein
VKIFELMFWEFGETAMQLALEVLPTIENTIGLA